MIEIADEMDVGVFCARTIEPGFSKDDDFLELCLLVFYRKDLKL
jgi:hypothetical protein